MAKEKQRLIVGVSGASGLVYAVRALETLRSLNIETHLVVSKPGDVMRAYESALEPKGSGGARRRGASDQRRRRAYLVRIVSGHWVC